MQRPPAKGGNVPPQYDWHQQVQDPRDAPLTQNYPAHQLTNPHQPPGRGGMNLSSSSSRNLHHNLPPPGHSAPLLPLPVPQGYTPPPPAMQGPSKHHSGQGGQGSGQKYSPAHHPPSQQQQQVNLGDLSAGTMSLADLVPRVQALGFPASCNFVLGLLERYFSSKLDSAKDSSNPQLAQDNITGLVNMFILHIDRTTPPAASRGRLLSAMNPVKEMQLLLILHAQLKDQANVELRYCIFDALFGGETKSSSDRFELLSKLVSLSITLVSDEVLLCAAVWMKAYPLLGLSLAKSLFYEFCVLLPDALDPLLGLADHSPLFAYHMAAAFTTLYPLHIVGKHFPEVDSAHLHPPIKILRIILHWVESKPDLFCRSWQQDLDPSKLPLLHSSPTPHSTAPLNSPITGIIQWCVLAPMVDDQKLYSGTKLTDLNKIGTKFIDSNKTGTGSGINFSNLSNSTGSVPAEDGFQSFLARLHAELLSALLSHSQAPPSHSSGLIDGLSSDDVAVLVASLIAYGQKVGVAVGGDRSAEMEASVERFAQFLQISMSAKVLQLKPEDIKFIASTLPRNRLLELVITHTK